MSGRNIRDYGLMVQTERPLHEPAASYVDVYEGSGPEAARRGKAILRFWMDRGNDPSFIGRHHRARAEREAREMIAAWEHAVRRRS